jgi:phosphorylcholine metabolism protein LicD
MAGKLKLTGKMAVIAKKMLKDVCQILDENDIPYIVDNGTLLGIIRENRLIPWDNDVDIAVNQKYLDKLIKIRYKFWLAGYRTRIRKSKKDMPHFPKGSVRIIKIQTRWFIFKRFTLLDIFIKKGVDDQCYWTMSRKYPILLSAPKHFYENTIRYEFDGYHYLIPGNYEDYLVHRYGDWKTPMKEFNFKKDDLAIVSEKEK